MANETLLDICSVHSCLRNLDSIGLQGRKSGGACPGRCPFGSLRRTDILRPELLLCHPPYQGREVQAKDFSPSGCACEYYHNAFSNIGLHSVEIRYVGIIQRSCIANIISQVRVIYALVIENYRLFPDCLK